MSLEKYMNVESFLTNDLDDQTDGSEVAKTFAGSTVFLTGGTGFLGKLLIEKLLRSCPRIKKLYVLARPKRGKDIMKRLQEQCDDVVGLYDRLKKVQPNFMEKIDIIEGDIGQQKLGISEEDRTKLVNEVEFIFHGAATVRMEETLKKAVEINVRGTRDIMLLARSCTKLRAHVHISTAYSNCVNQEIDEKYYSTPIPGDKLIDLVESADEDRLVAITPGLLGGYPNTYTYTKAAAEDIVHKYSKDLPVAMIRPSIVISTAEEPIPGWIDNVYGPTGVVVGAGVGLLRVVNCDPKTIAELVPVDYVVNSCIAIAWKIATNPENHANTPADRIPPIYNYVSSVERPITWDYFLSHVQTYGLQVPSAKAVWSYLLLLIPSPLLYNILCYLLHWIPAYIIDGIAFVIGKKPILRKVYQKIYKFSAVISHFATHQWDFHNNNTQNLFKELSDVDRRLFNFNMAALDWEEYYKPYVIGVRLYLAKDPLDTLAEGRTRQFRLKMINYLILTLICFGLFKLVLFFTKFII